MTVIIYCDAKRFPINGGDDSACFRLEIVDDVINRVYVMDNPTVEENGFYNNESWILLKMHKINSGYYVVNYDNNTIPVHRIYGYYLYYSDKRNCEKDQKYKLPFERYQIDHINRQRDDLSINNMRLVPISENMKNRDLQRYEYKIIDTEEELNEGDFIPIVFDYEDTEGVIRHSIIYKHGDTFYKQLRGNKRVGNIYITPYKELPYRHDRDTTPGNRTYLVRYNGKTHEFNEQILNNFADEAQQEIINNE